MGRLSLTCQWGVRRGGSRTAPTFANPESVESVPCFASVECEACSANAESKENARPTKKLPINGPKLPIYGEMRVMGRESIGLAFSR